MRRHTNSRHSQNNDHQEINMGQNDRQHCSAHRGAGRRTTQIRFSPHARDRMRQYDVRDREVRAAVGADIVDAAGAFTCRDAAADHRHQLLQSPRTGAPLRLGIGFTGRDHCRQRAARTVLLVVLPGGRRMHLVCVPYVCARLEVVSLWDPDAPENDGLWTTHAQLPTERGARNLPYCRWLLADPFDRRRPTFRWPSSTPQEN